MQSFSVTPETALQSPTEGHVIRQAVVLAFVGSMAVLSAQAPTPPTSQRSFEIASVKPNTSGASITSMGTPPGGRFSARNVRVRELIAYAFGTPAPFIPLANNRVVGGPSWLDTDRVDIEAIGNTTTATEFPQILAMLRTLLAERFNLVAHMERRELPVYVLTLARSDGSLGPRLQRTELGCAAQAARTSATPAVASGPSPSCGMQKGRNVLNANGMTLDTIILHGLSPHLDRVVVDETGLQGEFDLALEWGADQVLRAGDIGASQAAGTPGASMVTAIEDQLGLKLQSVRRPVEVLVIDSVGRPTPN
jgi:uncharacterized protein (TIGR03435 family)